MGRSRSSRRKEQRADKKRAAESARIEAERVAAEARAAAERAEIEAKISAEKEAHEHYLMLNHSLLQHIREGNYNAMLRDISDGADINFHDEDANETPLSVAVQTRDVLILNSLCQLGADIHFTNKLNENLLHIAINYRHRAGADNVKEHIKLLKTTKFLIDHGIAANDLNCLGENVWQVAGEELSRDIEIFNWQRQTQFDNLRTTTTTNHEIQLSRMQRAGVDPQVIADKFALILAVQRNDIFNVKLLAEHGVSLLPSPTLNNTLLHFAAKAGHVEITQYLCKYGAPVDRKNTSGNTALHNAVVHDHPEIVEVLLQNGAKPNIVNYDGKSPRVMAAENKNESIISIFMEYQTKETGGSTHHKEEGAAALAAEEADAPVSEDSVVTYALNAASLGPVELDPVGAPGMNATDGSE